MALSWLPQLMLDDYCPTGKDPSAPLVAAVEALKPDHYALTSLSVHGLWPEFDESHAPYGWPQYCMRDDTAGCADVSEDDPRCGLLQSTRTSFNTSELWQRTALPFAYDRRFAQHEWRRHGTCTPFTQLAYFDAVEDTREALNARGGMAAVRRAIARSAAALSLIHI